ncbi:hemerythrin domain-containing protein [Mariniluteicoccus flavus]
MCEYCGCHQNDNIAQLMDEHDRLMVIGDTVRRALADDDLAGAQAAMAEFRPLLAVHTKVEEAGIFAVMREAGDFVEVIDELEEEHRTLDADLARLDDPDALRAEIDRLLADLEQHIEKENRGIFPYAYSAFAPEQWGEVEAAHEADHARRHELGIAHEH